MSVGFIRFFSHCSEFSQFFVACDGSHRFGFALQCQCGIDETQNRLKSMQGSGECSGEAFSHAIIGTEN